MLAILVILPMLIAALIAVLMHRSHKRLKYISYIALIASIISLALIASVYYNQTTLQSTTWFSISGFQFMLSTTTAPLNFLLLLIVGIMSPLIIAYSIGFMRTPSEQSRYYLEICIFVSAMMLFAISADFITMLIGWELLGVTSYLLIGFWYHREGTSTAARKAITTILIGDILMFAAMVLIWSNYHTFSFAALIQQAEQSSIVMPVSLVLIIGAIFTKSAQFPFHEWLPDAMKGPTPVSAFLHSSTMVKAGVFLAIVLLPLFMAYHLTIVFLVFGAITAIIGITNALTETHVKRVLAYSTIEDLGLMFIALGLGSLEAALMLFVVQTFYKALLFMSAGSMIKINDNEEEMDKMHNSLRYLKITIPTIIAVLSLAALYPLSGFFGKASIDAAAASGNAFVYALLLLFAFLSNLYIFRWLFIPLEQRPQTKIVSVKANYKKIPMSMVIPMFILSALVAVGGIAYMYLPSYISQYTRITVAIGTTDIIISIVITALGLVAAYLIFYRMKYTMDQLSPEYKALHNSTVTNKVYLSIVQSFNAFSDLYERLDHELYNVIKDAARGVGKFADLLKKIEDGSTNTYLAAFIIGLAVILILFIL